jgi:predicted O-methyltransferase YrrM
MVISAETRRTVVIGAFVGMVVMLASYLSAAIWKDSAKTASAAIAAGSGLCVAFGRKWYRQTVRLIERQTEHLGAIASLSGMVNRQPVYWSPHAFAPETLALVLHLMRSLQPRRVLELGTGVSTLFIAKFFMEAGAGVVDSFDHDARWVEASIAALAGHGLTAYARVKTAQLSAVRVRGAEHSWYGLPSFEPGTAYDFIIVDGPPSWQGQRMARLPALYCLKTLMTPTSVLLLDDAERESERAIAELWQEDFKELFFRRVSIGRGLLVVSASSMVFELLP